MPFISSLTVNCKNPNGRITACSTIPRENPELPVNVSSELIHWYPDRLVGSPNAFQLLVKCAGLSFSEGDSVTLQGLRLISILTADVMGASSVQCSRLLIRNSGDCTPVLEGGTGVYVRIRNSSLGSVLVNRIGAKIVSAPTGASNVLSFVK
jgi:hypothetical protein